MKYPFLAAQIITEYSIQKVNQEFMDIGKPFQGDRLQKMFVIFHTDKYNPNINSTLTGYFDSIFRVLLKSFPSQVPLEVIKVLKIVLREENIELLLKYFDDFSVMGILLKIVCIESNLVSSQSDGLFLSNRKDLLYKILDKFLKVETQFSASMAGSQTADLDFAEGECILMNGAAFFRYLIKDMNVIDSGIINLIKEPADFFEKILAPLFQVLSP